MEFPRTPEKNNTKKRYLVVLVISEDMAVKENRVN
jgi:hypothetical protein